MLPHRRYPLAAIQELTGQKVLFNTLFNFVQFHVYRRLSDVEDLQVSSGWNGITLSGKFVGETSYTVTVEAGGQGK
mgnify:CR=1 FL=1